MEEEEDGGLSLDRAKLKEGEQHVNGFDAKLCVVARFLSEGHVDFPAMQQTMAALGNQAWVYTWGTGDNSFLVPVLSRSGRQESHGSLLNEEWKSRRQQRIGYG